MSIDEFELNPAPSVDGEAIAKLLEEKDEKIESLTSQLEAVKGERDRYKTALNKIEIFDLGYMASEGDIAIDNVYEIVDIAKKAIHYAPQALSIEDK